MGINVNVTNETLICCYVFCDVWPLVCECVHGGAVAFQLVSTALIFLHSKLQALIFQTQLMWSAVRCRRGEDVVHILKLPNLRSQEAPNPIWFLYFVTAHNSFFLLLYGCSIRRVLCICFRIFLNKCILYRCLSLVLETVAHLPGAGKDGGMGGPLSIHRHLGLAGMSTLIGTCASWTEVARYVNCSLKSALRFPLMYIGYVFSNQQGNGHCQHTGSSAQSLEGSTTQSIPQDLWTPNKPKWQTHCDVLVTILVVSHCSIHPSSSLLLNCRGGSEPILAAQGRTGQRLPVYPSVYHTLGQWLLNFLLNTAPLNHLMCMHCKNSKSHQVYLSYF